MLAQSLHNSHVKRTFLQSFAEDPALFIQTWLESQSRDLENIIGSGPTEGLTVRQEELKRSEFFQLPWVEEVCVSLLFFGEFWFMFFVGCCHSGGYAIGCKGDGIVPST